jgi:predicted MFS family arabinose efflux permease
MRKSMSAWQVDALLSSFHCLLVPMSTTSSLSSVRTPSVIAMLLPIMATVLCGFLVTGLAMPVLPLHVHQGLGMGTFVVGLVAGAQFGTALISRFWSGTYADSRGAKRAVVSGLLLAVAAGVLYQVSLHFVSMPKISVAVLLLGRAVLGAAESFIITGSLSWGLSFAGPQNTGKVIAWIGTAMYVAFAAGAPVGTALYASYGFAAIGLATAVLPLAALLLVAPLRAIMPTGHARAPFTKVVGAVWVPGVGLAFSSLGFGAITTFISLLFASRGWGSAWLAFSGFSLAFVIARALLGHLPDKVGGAKAALVSLLFEAAGLALIWMAPGAVPAFAGAMLTGFGYSLVYPGFGIEAVRRAPPQSRGLAMGAFTAFFDLALGIGSPALGFVGNTAGVASIFLVSAVVVLCATAIAWWLLSTAPAPGRTR